MRMIIVLSIRTGFREPSLSDLFEKLKSIINDLPDKEEKNELEKIIWPIPITFLKREAQRVRHPKHPQQLCGRYPSGFV